MLKKIFPVGRIAAFFGCTQDSIHFALIAISIFGVVSGTVYHILSIGAQTTDNQRCFFNAVWKKDDNPSFGGSLSCLKNKTDCREMENGPVIPSENIVSVDAEINCYTPQTNYSSNMNSSWSTGNGGGGYSCTSDSDSNKPAWPDCARFSCMSGNWTCAEMRSGTNSSWSSSWSSNYSYWSQSKQKSFPLTAQSDCDGLVSRNEIPASELDWCKMAIGGGMHGGGYQGGGTQGGGMNVEQCMSGCSSMTGSEEQKTMCRTGCSNMGQPGGYQGGGYGSGPFNGGQGSNAPGPRMCGPNEYPTAQNPCMYNPMGGMNQHGGTRPCAQDEQPVNGSCYLQRGTNPMQGGNNQGGFNQGGFNQGGFHSAGGNNNMPGSNDGWFYPGMMDSMQGGNQEEMMQEQQERMLGQMKSEGARQCQHFLDPLQSAFNMPKTMQDAIKDYHKKCLDGVQTATSPDEFYKLMESLRMEMTGLFQKTAGCDGVESFIRGMEQGATNDAPRFIQQTQKKNPTLAAQMENMRQETIVTVNAAKKQVAGGDCKAARLTMETMEQRFEVARKSWGNDFSIVDGDVMADHFTEKMQKRGVNISEGDLQKYGIAGSDHMDVMSGLMTYSGENMTRLFQDESGVNIIKTLTAGGASSEKTALMAQILEENKRLREEVRELRAQLNKTQAALADRLSLLTADTKITSQIHDFVANELGDTKLTPKEADEIYEAFMIENGKELVKQGLVTNIDLNLGDWYTPIVVTANKEGFMKGDPTGYFRPSAEMNQAEAAVTMARAFGVEMTEGAVPSDRRFADYPEWSLASIEALEQNDIDLSILSARPDQPITRSQVSVLLSDLLPGEASEGESGKVFTDLSSVDERTKDAIHELSALGITNGVNNGSKYNPNGAVDRATFAAYLTRSVDAAEEFLGVNDEEGAEQVDESAQESVR